MVPNLGQTGQKWAPNFVFFLFFNFGSLDLNKITYNYSFEQRLTISRCKTYKKKIKCPKFGLKRPKVGPKFCFLSLFQVSVVSFELSYIQL